MRDADILLVHLLPMLVAALAKCELDAPDDATWLADGDWLQAWDMDPD